MPKADNIETLQRVRQVMEWMLEGYLTGDIVKSCTGKWGIEERQAYKYIKKALSEFKAITAGSVKERVAFHTAARMKLFNGLARKTESDGAGVALNILKDIAKLEGLYVEKVDLTSKGKALNTKPTIVKATLKLD